MTRGITFDYWRTLIFENPGELQRSRIELLAGVFGARGESVSTDVLTAAHEFAFSHAAPSWQRNEQYTAEHAVDHMLGQLDIPATPDLRRDAVAAFIEGGRVAQLHVVDGVGEALEEVRAAGMRVGIICDVGLTPSTVLRWHLQRADLLRLFDHWSFSDEVGVYKPDRRIFEHAAAGLRVDLGEMTHVGDQRRTDVAGARAAGARSVRYRGVFDDLDDTIPDADHVIDSFGDLRECL